MKIHLNENIFKGKRGFENPYEKVTHTGDCHCGVKDTKIYHCQLCLRQGCSYHAFVIQGSIICTDCYTEHKDL